MTAIVPTVVAREALAVASRERALLVPVAGCLILLPQLAALLALPKPPPMAAGAGLADYATAMNLWVQANLLPLFGLIAVALLGQATIVALLIDQARPTVAQALGRGLAALPWLLLATLFTNLAIGGGLLLLVLPGLYLMGRAYLVTVTMVAEGWRNPIAGVIRAMRLTMGIGWMLFAILAVVWLMTTTLGTLFAGVAAGAGPGAVAFVAQTAQAAVETTGSVVHLLIGIAVYRRVATRG